MPVPRLALGLVVIALTLSLAYGIWYAYSVVLVALLREFGWSRSVLAGAFSAFTLVHGAANPLVGALCDRMRPMRLVTVGGVLLGLSLWADSFIAAPLPTDPMYSSRRVSFSSTGRARSKSSAVPPARPSNLPARAGATVPPTGHSR